MFYTSSFHKNSFVDVFWVKQVETDIFRIVDVIFDKLANAD